MSCLPASHSGPGGTASFEGGSQQRTLTLYISVAVIRTTPEEGFRLPGQAQLFSFTQHSAISLRTCRHRAKGVGLGGIFPTPDLPQVRISGHLSPPAHRQHTKRRGLTLQEVRALSSHFPAGNWEFRGLPEPWGSTGNASSRFKGKSICKAKLLELRVPSLLQWVTREHPTSLATGGSA